MRLLVLSEGDADSQERSGSGTPNSVVAHLRKRGHDVVTGDVDLYGVPRLLAAAAAFSPERRRWMVKYHLGGAPFSLRSRNAARHVARRRGRVDAVLQYGATSAPPRGDVPYYLYCDSHVGMGAAREPHMWTSALSVAEFERAVERERGVYQGTAAIFTFSEQVRRSFIQDMGIAPERVETVYAGPNLDPASVPPRESGDVPGDAPRADILFVGREFERKGGDLLVRALRRVRAIVPEATLTVVGPRALQLDEPGVRVLGYLSKDDAAQLATMMAAYAGARVFAFPTRFEPFGIVLLEAMLHELPCVASAVGAIPEIVADGETGYTVPSDDEEALAARLVELLRDPARARRMGAAGRERVLRHFTWDAVTDKMTRRMESDLALGASGRSRRTAQTSGA